MTTKPLPAASLERFFKVWNEYEGSHIQVGPDNDGLGLCEVRQVDENGVIITSVAFSWLEAKLLGAALLELAQTQEKVAA